jgi:hypothetical protein
MILDLRTMSSVERAFLAELNKLRAAAQQHVEARERLKDFAHADDDDPEYAAAYAADLETFYALRDIVGKSQ